MKSIWIMRHGDAPYINGERQISEQGHEDIKQMALWFSKELGKHNLSMETLLVSPILRAQQTADTFEKALLSHLSPKKQEVPWQKANEPLLKSEADPKIVVPFVEQATAGTTLLISHMPLVSHLWAEWLTGESQYFPTSAIGGVIVDINGEKATRKLVFHSPS